MEFITLVVILVIVLALFFDFTNGFHDTANAMATPIATGALKPKTAVALCAVLNLVGAFLSTEVSKTVSGGIIREEKLTAGLLPELIFAGLIAAICWNMLTWLFGLPSSSSHALFGGLIGATLVGFGASGVNFSMVLSKIVLPALLSPVIAGIVAFAATKIAYQVTRRYDKKPDGRDGFRVGQILTSSLVALAHGTNDAQKTMGVITMVFITVGWQSADHHEPHIWVVVACAGSIALGTYLGGWRIIHTLGEGLTEVKPAQGFSAESSTSATILASSALGFPLSTTQVASGSVIGSGVARRGAEVRWSTAGKIVVGWVLTLPVAAILGALAALLVVGLGHWGVLVSFVIAAVVVLGLFLFSRTQKNHPAEQMQRNKSYVAESGKAVNVPETVPPTRRQQEAKARRKAAKARRGNGTQDAEAATGAATRESE